ncbi:NADH-ubiquinone oxidoreductase [Artemisia annua]|uniref:NADH-ubiquinone oxidoreductase n=1 Tax=Artemisia annua TaxID=35608 RepID=A0A2U1LGU4_ARTAN|nr:NADH-ubiquinone oxidoreductase [Artemisia annua]
MVRWENSLVGLTSTYDPYANVGDDARSFTREEDEKAFSEKNGWNYTLEHYSSIGRMGCLLHIKLYFMSSFVQTDYTKKYSILDSEALEKGNRGDSASTISSLHLIPAYIRDEHMDRYGAGRFELAE